MANFFALAYAIVAGMTALTFIYTLFCSRTRNSDRSPLMYSLLYFSIATFIWNLAYAIITLSDDKETVKLLYQLSSLGWAFCPSLAGFYGYLLYARFLDKNISKPITIALFIPVPLIWVGIFSGNMLATDFIRTPHGWIEKMDPGSPWNIFFILMTVIGMFLFVYYGIRFAYNQESKRAAFHARIVTFPLLFIVSLALVFHVLLPLMSISAIPPVIQILVGFWVVFIAAVQQRYPVLSLSPEIAAEKIIECMSDIFFLISHRKIIIETNHLIQDTLGYRTKQLSGTPAADFFPKEVQANLVQSIDEQNKKSVIEASLPGADGQSVPCAVSISTIHDTFGEHVGFIIIAQEIREIKRLRELAIKDELTGAFNRRKIDDALHISFSNLRQYQRPFSLIMIDLDHFKSVNDNFGHDTGDTVLIEMSRIVIRTIRNSDIYIRWGGEEFVILCPDTPASNALKLAERIRKNLQEHDFSFDEGITASFGIAGAAETDNNESLIRKADKALYISKAEGRNRCTIIPGAEMVSTEHE